MKKPPNITLNHLVDKEIGDRKQFLKVSRNWYEVNYPNGDKSEPILIDKIDRIHNDAVVIIAWAKVNGEIKVYLRSCVRPALYPENVNIWEFAAGLIEGEEEPKMAASRECLEELGFEVPPEKFEFLGNYILPTASMVPEKVWFLHTEVDPALQKEPSLDGSPLERNGEVISVGLDYLYDMYCSGDNNMLDSKTELGTYRFFNYLINKSKLFV